MQTQAASGAGSVSVWTPGELRLLAVTGNLGVVLGWCAFPAAALSLLNGCESCFGAVGAAPLVPLLGLASALCVRMGTCGRWVRDLDTSAWPDVRRGAQLALYGPASVLAAACVLALAGPTRAYGNFALEMTAWLSIPTVVEAVLLSRSADLLRRSAERPRRAAGSAAEPAVAVQKTEV